MNNIIKALKENRYAFGLWPEVYGEEQGRAMQAKAKEIGRNGFHVYWPNESPTGWSENKKKDPSVTVFVEHMTYRLGDDYTEPSEINKPYDGPAPPLRPPGSQGKDNRF